MTRFLLVTTFLLFALPAWAQRETWKTEAGGTIGGGDYDTFGDSSSERFVTGAEVCLTCDGEFALFAGYQHWKKPFGAKSIFRADTAFGGLRRVRS